MSKELLVSICIPAYKRVDYLKRLLHSISIQTFKDFEVVITDDSNDESVSQFIASGAFDFPLVYIKNPVALGSPENWNSAIRQAKGQWIKMMHDDDWFADENSLQQFAGAAEKNKAVLFIFSGYCETDVQANTKKDFVINDYYLSLLKRSPLSLFKQNFIGHPSTTLIRNDRDAFYDKNLKWVVDIEFYIRYLNKHKSFAAIKKPLINIGLNEHQITKQAFRNPAIEIPETLYLFHKLPRRSMRNIFAYDYYWRLIRNLSIRSETDINKYAGDIVVPALIIKMIKLQSKWPHALLKKGVFSKVLMLYSYLSNYSLL
jgi:glycosyltransferase involved in cell wall biosynthesis